MIKSFASSLLIALVLSAMASAQSAYGIRLPVRGAPEASGPTESAVVDEASGIDKVKAENLDDAAAGAARQAAAPAAAVGQSRFRRIEGASLFEDANGRVGLMVTGQAKYRSSYPNPDAIRLARRSAYVAAYADAMKTLTEKVYGASLERKIEILNTLKQTVDESATREDSASEFQEAIDASISGMIRGAQIWKCADEGATVRIWMFLTPESAAACRVVGGDCKVASPSGYQAAVDSVLDECKNGFLPPIGGKCVVAPESGVMTFVGFGSAIITATASGETFAIKKAKLRAKAGLVGVITGQQIDVTSQTTTQEAQASADYQSYVQAQPAAGSEQEIMAKVQSSFRAISELKESISMATKGRLPPGTQDMSFIDDKNGWVTTVYIYSHGSDKLMEALRSDYTGSPIRDPGAEGESGGAKTKRPTYDPHKRGPSGQGPDPRKRKG